MPSKKYTTPIREGRVFHIFNRGINHQDVFLCDEDKKCFLNRVRKYLSDYADILAYSILDNHYHILVRIKEGNDPSSCFSKQFAKLILSYTYYYNRKYGHSGPIFHRCFKRLEVNTQDYLRKVFWYVNANPAHHNSAADYRNYGFSSLACYLGGKPDGLTSHSLVAEIFGSRRSLLDFLEGSHDVLSLGILTMEG